MASKKHAELIRAWLDGAEIQYRSENDGLWYDYPEPTWVSHLEYRIKPAEPERVYPPCAMSEDEVIAAWAPPYGWKGLRAFGDKVLRHACDKGQIFTREEFDRAVGDRKARDMAVARAVINRFNMCLDNDSARFGLPRFWMGSSDSDIESIIAEVK